MGERRPGAPHRMFDPVEHGYGASDWVFDPVEHGPGDPVVLVGVVLGRAPRRLLGRFGPLWGAKGGPPGGAKSARELPRSGPGGPETPFLRLRGGRGLPPPLALSRGAPRWPQEAPRNPPKEPPGRPQDSPKEPREGPESAPKRTQESPEMAVRVFQKTRTTFFPKARLPVLLVIVQSFLPPFWPPSSPSQFSSRSRFTACPTLFSTRGKRAGRGRHAS